MYLLRTSLKRLWSAGGCLGFPSLIVYFVEHNLIRGSSSPMSEGGGGLSKNNVIFNILILHTKRQELLENMFFHIHFNVTKLRCHNFVIEFLKIIINKRRG